MTTISPLAIGNAFRFEIDPPQQARRWRVLRRDSGTFSGPTDPGATVIHDGCDTQLVDATGLINGTTYQYAVYYFDGSVWTLGDSLSGAPAASYSSRDVDVIALLKERLDAGLGVELARGELQSASGTIPVFTSAALSPDPISFPFVTISLREETPADEAIATDVIGDLPDTEGGWKESEGWWMDVKVDVVGWSDSLEGRSALRRSLRRIVIGNLPVFDALSMQQVGFSQQDAKDFQSFGAPSYMTQGLFVCRAPALVEAQVPEILDVNVTATAEV